MRKSIISVIAAIRRCFTTELSRAESSCETMAGYAQLEPRILYSASPIDSTDFDGELDGPFDAFDFDQVSPVGMDDVSADGDPGVGVGFGLNEFEFEFVESGKPTTLIVIDSLVDDLDQLLEGIELNPAFRLEVLVLESERDGIAQITDRLATLWDVESMHVVAHGSDGAVQLGNTVLTANSLDCEQSDGIRRGAEPLARVPHR